MLPEEVVHLARQEKWTSYSSEPRLDPFVVERVFGEEPFPSWHFYDLDEIDLMTQEWRLQADEGWFGSPPHNLDVQRSLLVGELGSERPFALDFRGSDEPLVRFMTFDARWRRIASSAGELLSMLGIEV